MNGVGFLIWRLSQVKPIEKAIAALKRAEAEWVSIKFLDGLYRSNLVDADGKWTNEDSYLKEFIARLRSEGIKVGGWAFIYPGSSIPTQANMAADIVYQYGLDHWLIDAEHVSSVGALWKTGDTGPDATRYMDNLHVPSGFPVALCSYRFPRYHPEFPFAEFVKHKRSTFIASQMYWAGAHNPDEQLEASIAEYNKIAVLPHVPIGAAYEEWGWEPFPSDLVKFVDKAEELYLSGEGFWSLDSAIDREDWLDSIAAANDASLPVPPDPEPDPEPEPEPEPEPGDDCTLKVGVVQVDGLRVRSEIIPSVRYGRVPGVVYKPSTVWFSISASTKVDIIEEIKDGKNTWLRIGHRQYIAKVYDDKTYVTIGG